MHATNIYSADSLEEKITQMHHHWNSINDQYSISKTGLAKKKIIENLIEDIKNNHKWQSKNIRNKEKKEMQSKKPRT